MQLLKSLQLCPTLSEPIDGSPPGSSIPGIVQARILEWVAISFSNACMHAKSLQLCQTLCDPMDNSPPGSSVHRILQATVLEWVAISFSVWTTESTCLLLHYYFLLVKNQSSHNSWNSFGIIDSFCFLWKLWLFLTTYIQSPLSTKHNSLVLMSG